MISTKHIHSYCIRGIDGPAGDVCDVYFDDEAWVVRYLVVKTARRSGRPVLIPSVALGAPDPFSKVFCVLLTRQQIAESPHIDTDKPVSRQHQMGGVSPYEYSPYWTESFSGAQPHFPGIMIAESARLSSSVLSDEAQTLCARADALNYTAAHAHDDPHLRRALAMTNYHVHATDGDIGHVRSVLIDEKTWVIRYLVVNTSVW